MGKQKGTDLFLVLHNINPGKINLSPFLVLIKRWEVPFRPRDLYTQYRFFRSRFRGVILFQVGCFLEMFDKDAVWAKEHIGLAAITPRKGLYARCGVPMRKADSLLVRLLDNDFLLVMQSRYVHGRI